MADLPFLGCEPVEATPRHAGAGGANVGRLPAERQRSRLAERWNRVEAALAEAEIAVAPGDDADPDLIVVFETRGDPQNVIDGFDKLGLETLSEASMKAESDADFFGLSRKKERKEGEIPGTVYAVLGSASQIRSLLALWNKYLAGESLRKTSMAAFFGLLSDVRPWDESDRLKALGLSELLLADAELSPNQLVTVHVEFFFRRDAAKRAEAEAGLTTLIDLEPEAIVNSRSEREEFGYHALSVTVPRRLLASRSNDGTELVYGEVGRFRPIQTVTAAPQGVEAERATESLAETPVLRPPEAAPSIVLLDGLPLVGHELLTEHVTVIDSFDFSAQYPVENRVHGTEMASCIVHGDLSDPTSAVETTVIAVPVMLPVDDGFRVRERIPPTLLPAEVMCRALEAVFGEGGEVTSGVRVVSLSIGDPDAPFQLQPSGWARALDWLSWKYNLLFLVAAGNHPSFAIDLAPDGKVLGGDDLDAAVRTSLSSARLHRRLLSPSESVNAVTVGALHEDASAATATSNQFDPRPVSGGVSPISPFGQGVGRSIKPDVLFPGGRQTFTSPITASGLAVVQPSQSPLPPGIKVASPTQASPNRGYAFRSGTSHATALAAGHACRLLQTLRESVSAPADYEAVLVKALLVHGARVGDLAIDEGLEDMRGYGVLECDLRVGCLPHRATLVAWGEVRSGEAVDVVMPLPPSLAAVRGVRTLTTTLAWLSATSPGQRPYRASKLTFRYIGHPLGSSNVFQRAAPDWRATQRGTVQHDVRTGTRAVALATPSLTIGIDSNVIAERTVDDRFGIAVTLEVDPALGIDVYEEVRTGLVNAAESRSGSRVQNRPAAG